MALRLFPRTHLTVLPPCVLGLILLAADHTSPLSSGPAPGDEYFHEGKQLPETA